MRALLFAAVFLLGLGPIAAANAQTSPYAAGSPVSGLNFDDRPLLLSSTRGFDLALGTVGQELGRQCVTTENYGWRLTAKDQPRLDRIFNQSLDRLRGAGYTVTANRCLGGAGRQCLYRRPCG